MSATYEDRIASLEEDYNVFIDNLPEPGEEEEDENPKEALLAILEEFLDILREAEDANYEGLPSLVERLDGVLNNAVMFAADDDAGGPFGEDTPIPSFAHHEEKGPLLKDTIEDGKYNHGFLAIVMPFMRELYGELPDVMSKNPDEMEHAVKSQVPQPWKKTVRPHPLSSLCSRFREPIPEWDATDANERATSVFEARCEIGSGDIHSPIDMALSSNGNVLALSSMGGWKNRTPYLWFYLPNHDIDTLDGFMRKRSIRADLTDSLLEILLNEERSLLFVADYTRIKSYRYHVPSADEKSRKAMRVHTMASADYTGPMTLLGDGRLLRAGKGHVAVWELDALQTHGENGLDIIGTRIAAKDMDTWRDDPENIEGSTGSVSSSSFKLEGFKSQGQQNEGPVIKKWHPHPSHSNVMLCGMDQETSNNYCHAYDLQAGGKISSRYLGHGGSVNGFSSVTTDPNVFLTWSNDGHARLYDARHPLPVLTVAGAKYLRPLPAAVLAHPDGIPFIFTTTREDENIKLWDVRFAKALIYELATGNNVVESMAWDSATNSLYAATSCPHIDWNGRHMEYRMAKIPKPPKQVTVQNSEDATAEGDDEDGYVSENEDVCWPKRAHHAENHFGHVFDAADHRLYKYTYKMDPDPDMLPYYGSASLNRGFW